MNATNNIFGKYFGEFSQGDVYKHFPKKTITESDNNLFCQLTMNHHPLHLDEDYASKTVFKRRVVVGTYIISLVVGMSVPDISGKAIANLDYEKIVHNAPVFIGDTIHASSIILDVRESKTKTNEGIIFVETKAYNQKNELVLTLRRHILVPKKLI